jgi:hypothetical protein
MSCCGGKPCGKPAAVSSDGVQTKPAAAAADDNVKESVQEYYGKTVKTKDDLKTGACIPPKGMSRRVKGAMARVHEDIIIRSEDSWLLQFTSTRIFPPVRTTYRQVV